VEWRLLQKTGKYTCNKYKKTKNAGKQGGRQTGRLGEARVLKK
jgi:hypothetical protein